MNKLDLKYEVCQLKTSSKDATNYSYIVVDKGTKKALIIDPAWELDTVTNKLTELKVELVSIVLTHSHFDHVDLVEPLCRIYNPSVYMSKEEIDYYNFRCKNLCSLNDNDILSNGETSMTCLLTPGHTAGSMCYLLPDRLFSGDTIFIEGCGLCNCEGGSAIQMYKSIQRIKSTLSPDIAIYPGHSYGKSSGYPLSYLMKENIYLQIDKQDPFVKLRMSTSKKHSLE